MQKNIAMILCFISIIACGIARQMIGVFIFQAAQLIILAIPQPKK